MPDAGEISRIAKQLPSAWHASAKLDVARDIIRNRQRMALDAHPDFSVSRGDQMPSNNNTPSSAPMPPAMSDNYTGGGQFRVRNNAADQGGVDDLLQLVGDTLSRMSDEEVDQFVGGLNRMFGSSDEPPAADQEGQGSSVRLPIGQGVGPTDLMAPQGMRGTFSERDDLTSPRAAADRRPRDPRQRRAQAQDSVSYVERHRQFAARFPFVNVEVW